MLTTLPDLLMIVTVSNIGILKKVLGGSTRKDRLRVPIQLVWIPTCGEGYNQEGVKWRREYQTASSNCIINGPRLNATPMSMFSRQ